MALMSCAIAIGVRTVAEMMTIRKVRRRGI
jgi:hypothetical protein